MQRSTTIYNKVLATAFLILSLTSCVKDHLYDDTQAAPTEAQWSVVAVEIERPEGAENDEFVVEFNGKTISSSDGTYYFYVQQQSGEYDILAYNIPQYMTVTDDVASVDKADGTSSSLTDYIVPQPGSLFSGKARISITDNDTTRIVISVVPRTRDMHICLTVTEGDPERIVSVTGTLNGVAEAYDLWNETLYGDAASTSPTFSRDGDQVTADLRLLGINSDVQSLTLHILLSNGDTLDVESDLTTLLADFNNDTTPFTLTGDLHIPIEAVVEDAAITGWETVIGDSVTAE